MNLNERRLSFLARASVVAGLLLSASCGKKAPPGGGQGTGGAGTGGSGIGTGGSGIGTGGSGVDAPADRVSDVPSDPAPPDLGDPNAGPDLATCFAGLALTGDNFQTSNKQSADGSILVRLALSREMGGVGTSGTVPWRAVRLGIVTPTARLCWKEAELANLYKPSLHNCNDTLTVTSQGVTYTLKWPDTDVLLHKRDKTTLSIGVGTAAPLQTTSCIGPGGPNMCRSGGPC